MGDLLKKIGVGAIITSGIIAGGAYLLSNTPNVEANSAGQSITPRITYNNPQPSENPPIPEPETGILAIMGAYVIANRFFGRKSRER